MSVCVRCSHFYVWSDGYRNVGVGRLVEQEERPRKVATSQSQAWADLCLKAQKQAG
jgi:hypothetical protein